LYRGTLPVRIDEPGPVGNSEYLELAKAYILGDKLQDGDFKDIIINAMIDKCKSEASDGLLVLLIFLKFKFLTEP
jgi:hypothetical protein